MGLFDITGIGGITDVIKELIQLFPNAEQRAAAANKIQDVESAIAAQQSATNTAEASNASIFVSGWRPACGWLCVFALGYATVVAPVFKFPPGDVGTLVTILFGMLGLGGLRTFEKFKGIAK